MNPIKCPDCEETDFPNPISLRDHMEKRHQFKSLKRYAEQTFKIHEKIEYFEGMLENGWNEYTEAKIRTLKSLLENDSSKKKGVFDDSFKPITGSGYDYEMEAGKENKK